jgi:drug/metabolite transporter (DMT)-like permease
MRRPELLVLLAAFIWGVAFLFQKTAMQSVGPFTFLFARSALAALALAPFVRRETGGSLWPWAPLAGLAFFVAAGFQQSGIVTASVTHTSFLTSLYVVLTPFAAWVAFRRPPAREVWIGAGLALAGTWAMAGGDVRAFGRGEWLAIAGAVAWAAYMVLNQSGSGTGRPLGFTFGVFVTVAVLSLPVALVAEPITLPSLKAALPEMLFVGLCSSALTFGLFSIALRHVSGARAAVILSSEALFAALAGMVVLGERLDALGWAGAALILSAVVVVQRR